MRRTFRERPRLASLLVLGVVALLAAGFGVGLVAGGDAGEPVAAPRPPSEVERSLQAARDEARRSAREARDLLATARVQRASRERALTAQRRATRRWRLRARAATRRSDALRQALTRARRNRGGG